MKEINTKHGDRVDLLVEGTAIMVQTTAGALSGPAFLDAAGGAEVASELLLAALKLDPAAAVPVFESYGVDCYYAHPVGEAPEADQKSPRDAYVGELEAGAMKLAGLTAAVLEAAGFDGEVTEDGKSAIAFAAKLKADLVEERDQAEQSRRDFMALCEAAGVSIDERDQVVFALAGMRSELDALRTERDERLAAAASEPTPSPAPEAPSAATSTSRRGRRSAS